MSTQDKLAEALNSLRLKFTSGNDVPVPEARITRAEWEAIEQARAAEAAQYEPDGSDAPIRDEPFTGFRDGKRGDLVVDREALHASPGYKRQIAALAELRNVQAQAQSGEWVQKAIVDAKGDIKYVHVRIFNAMKARAEEAEAMFAAATQQAAEPVYQYQATPDSWVDCDYDLYNASGDPKRILYTHPQPAQDAKDAWPEEWRSFAEGYEVSSHGRTRSKGRLLQPYVKGKGYLAVSVWHGGKNKEMYVHRVVASAFCRRDDPSQDQVNHRDGDKLNNYASNLEWCTAKENKMHAARVLFSATRSVVGTNLKTGETITFRSLAEAEEHGFIRANIQKCIAGIRKKHGGFTWRDADAAIDAAMAKEPGDD